MRSSRYTADYAFRIHWRCPPGVRFRQPRRTRRLVAAGPDHTRTEARVAPYVDSVILPVQRARIKPMEPPRKGSTCLSRRRSLMSHAPGLGRSSVVRCKYHSGRCANYQTFSTRTMATCVRLAHKPPHGPPRPHRGTRAPTQQSCEVEHGSLSHTIQRGVRATSSHDAILIN